MILFEPMNNKVTIIIPTCKEIEGMKKIMPQIKQEWYDQIIVIDASSNDGTEEYARSMGYEFYTQKTFGLKNAYIEVFDKVRNDIVIAFSPDGNSIPELIPQLTSKLLEGDGYDMVTASRYKDGAKSDDDDWITAFGNWLFTKTINFVHNAKYTDAMVMYRAFRKNIFYDLDLHKHSTYWPEKIFFTDVCIMPILSIRAAKRKLRVADIPGDEPARIGGERKLQVVRWGLSYMTQVFTEKFFWK